MADQSSGSSNPQTSRDINKKRSGVLSWDKYFMATAFLTAKRSKDPVTQVGACIVNQENRIVSIGYNGMPNGDDEFPWSKEGQSKLDQKKYYVCHAEMNAIVNRNSADVKNCTMYVGLFPCNECAKIIIQSGIREVVYASNKHKDKVKTQAAKRMFKKVGIKCREYAPKEKIEIDFTEIDSRN
jgi:dCMP deaminase